MNTVLDEVTSETIDAMKSPDAREPVACGHAVSSGPAQNSQRGWVRGQKGTLLGARFAAKRREADGPGAQAGSGGRRPSRHPE